MKYFFFTLAVILFPLSMWAENHSSSYYNSHFDKNFDIKVFVENDMINEVWIGVPSQDGKDAYITVQGKDIPYFINSLGHVRDRFLEQVKKARENNSIKIHYHNDIFPIVGVMWIGTGLNIGNAYSVKIVMKALTMDDGKMVMSWTPKLEDTEDPYNEEQIYFILATEEDFNNLISALKKQTTPQE